jgi:hypothetical protein
VQDPRLRLGAVVLLSLAAFASIEGAIAAVLWWAVFTPRTRSLPSLGKLGGLALIVALVAALTQLLGGDGLAYAVKMGAILLIAAWAFSEQESGDLLAVSVWLFGTGWGFDIGLVAEMGVSAITQIESDMTAIRRALELKGRRWGPRSLIPAASSLLILQIRRSGEQAKILAVRGYRGGGTLAPEFHRTKQEAFAFFVAMLVFIAAFVPLRDVFIVIN